MCGTGGIRTVDRRPDLDRWSTTRRSGRVNRAARNLHRPARLSRARPTGPRHRGRGVPGFRVCLRAAFDRRASPIRTHTATPEQRGSAAGTFCRRG